MKWLSEWVKTDYIEPGIAKYDDHDDDDSHDNNDDNDDNNDEVVQWTCPTTLSPTSPCMMMTMKIIIMTVVALKMTTMMLRCAQPAQMRDKLLLTSPSAAFKCLGLSPPPPPPFHYL